MFEWLSKFINLERGQKPKSFRLDRMKVLAELAGNPERCAPSIHIAGSKGKGSVTGMAAAILTAAGFRTARYMSPHVIDIRERVSLGNSYFSEEIYCAAGNELREITEVRLPASISAAELFNPVNTDGCEPTFWELLTLFFFLCAKYGNCDVMVVETGMGGRLDSTNILDPLVSVITLIELEHTAILGNTIAEVAGEKAGIIKQGKPLVLAKQSEEALEVFRKKAQEKNSPLFYFPEIAELSNVNVHSDGTDFTLKMVPGTANLKKFNHGKSTNMVQGAFSIPIPGKVQAENTALAIAAVRTAFPEITENAIRRGLENFNIPARFEKIAGFTGPAGKATPPFIIDGAHTPESLELCIETFCSLYGEGGVLLFGCAADKDAAAMARIASPHFAKIIITTPGTFKTSAPALVYETFAALAGREKTLLVPDTQEAVKQAVIFAKDCSQTASHGDIKPKVCGVRIKEECKVLPILGTGSFYLVSEIRKIILN